MYKDKTIHFIGIGGISMSGIAEIIQSMGAIVTGSDMQESKVVKALEEKGIKITIGTNPDNIDASDMVVYTAAISEDNEELKRARELKKPTFERAEFLGELTKEYKHVLCISGTHGKSTTTGMISSVFLEAKLPTTIQIGAILPKINANYYVGGHDYFIMEACEYKDSFLSFCPTSAIVLNIDDDHLDYFKNLDNIKVSFTKYIHKLPKNGNLIINRDDENTMSLELPDTNIYTYGINSDADLVAKNITYDELGHPIFDVYFKNELYLSLHLSVLGKHNIYNALASVLMCLVHNVDKEAIIKGINEYHGVERRFEYIGKYKDNILVYDDYAHHPTEITSTYNAAKSIKCHQNWAIFQSHTYSRTKEHLEEFADILKKFDNVIIAPIYPARETNIYNVKEEDLVELIKKDNPNVCYIPTFEKIVKYLKENVQDNDLVLTIGAGPVNEVGLYLLDKK